MQGNLSIQGVEGVAGVNENYSIGGFILKYGAHGVYGCFSATFCPAGGL